MIVTPHEKIFFLTTHKHPVKEILRFAPKRPAEPERKSNAKDRIYRGCKAIGRFNRKSSRCSASEGLALRHKCHYFGAPADNSADFRRYLSTSFTIKHRSQSHTLA